MTHIIALRTLVTTVVTNTKKNVQGKPANLAKEKAATTTVLTCLLGRRPTEEEVNQVLAD